ncbi:AMP-binding protein [Limnochorda pilosa]|uniref:acetate--CoA ligase n=1 Tax=Limnochorda pilosa TaxID=1555112 RepID=A0A0K2SFM3_LIMPI|nr:AMP-binding protein [Limnochorda pilosa]BAS25890.1 AMP-dependent synthetase [Limnochorda pilosa]
MVHTDDGLFPAPNTPGAAWYPSERDLARSRLLRFIRAHGLGSLGELHRRSVQDPEWFWSEVLKDLDVRFHRPPERMLDLSRGPQWPRWFPGGVMNLAHNALDKWLETPKQDATAFVWEGDDGEARRYTYRELHREANRLAGGLERLGLRPRDRVGLFLPMIPETVVAMMALAKAGAILTPLFSGFGPEAVASRLADCEARFLITADGFYRRGKEVSMKAIADRAVEQVPSLERMVVVRRTGSPVAWDRHLDVAWDEVLAMGTETYETRRTRADEPFMIIYTSGTTGKPKGAVHVHSGFPLKAAQDLAHAFDLQEDDLLFWVTDMGWMMGPWMVYGALWLGASFLLFEGTPDHPHPGRLWELLERHRVTLLGVSPTAIRALMGKGEEWVRRYDRSSLRAIGSTGEPWNPEPWQWTLQVVGEGRAPIINYSGGTEISGGILGCYTILPLKPCSFGGPLPGMAADVVDEEGRPVRGGVGELVLRAPWPGQTSGFWQAPERYVETYWSRLPGLWVHGDWARLDSEGFWYLEGRSDDTLKVAGKRVGPAEVESALVSHPAVREAAVIGAPDPVKGTAIVAFVILNDASAATPSLAAELAQHAAGLLGKSLKPQEVHFVPEIPKTRNGKLMRRVLRAHYVGEEPGDLSALENPDVLQAIPRALGRGA